MDGPNAEQIRYWNETAGPKWAAFQGVLDRQLSVLGRRAMDRARPIAGERVIDVGCGCGDTTIELGRRVVPAGEALGIDVSAPMLAQAADAARAAAVRNVRFELADAQTYRFPPGGFDLVFSRFGVMFFIDPAAAFANLRAALRADGRLVFICWQALPENPWLFVPLRAASAHLTLPPPPAPDAPGPFAFADPERVRGILARARFADVELEPMRETLTVGGAATIDQAVQFLLEGVGPTTAALREADPAVRGRVAAAVRDALEPFATTDGVRMGSAAWLVSART
jgi:SAM-dependent methyltransferase